MEFFLSNSDIILFGHLSLLSFFLVLGFTHGFFPLSKKGRLVKYSAPVTPALIILLPMLLAALFASIALSGFFSSIMQRDTFVITSTTTLKTESTSTYTGSNGGNTITVTTTGNAVTTTTLSPPPQSNTSKGVTLMFKDFVWVALDGVGIPLFYKVGYTLGAMLATSAVSPATFVRTMMYRLVDMLPSRGKRVAPRRSPSVGIAGKQVKGFYVGKDGKIYLVTE